MDLLLEQQHRFFDSHEYQLQKQTNLPKTCSYVVTFVSNDTITSTTPSGNLSYVTPGTILGLNNELRTNNGRVEIRSNNGTIFRLGPNTSFSIQQTITGEIPIYYGEIYINSIRSTRIIDGGKYRSSCYIPGPINLVITKINEITDCYYTLEDSAEITEYDETGLSFQITHMEPLKTLDLSFNDDFSMRKRYTVTNYQDSSFKTINTLYQKWVTPTNWR